MSHHDLQRALVIALHDPAFLDELDAGLAALDLALAPAERSQLLAVDRRAIATDPLRRRRVLKALVEEYKASATLAAAHAGYAALDAFFGSLCFRRAIARGTPLPLALGDYLAGLSGPSQLSAVARLESALARARRATPVRLPPRHVALGSGVTPLAFDLDVIATVQALERFLFAATLVPQQAVATDPPPLPDLPQPGSRHYVLVTPPGTLADLDAGLHAVLVRFSDAVPLDQAAEALAQVGVTAGAVPDLLSALADDGLLSVTK